MPAAWIGAGAAAYTALNSGGGGSSSGTSTSTTQQQADPRIAALLLGDGTAGSTGLVQQWANSGNPMTTGQSTFGQTANNYIQNYGGADTNASRDAVYGLLQGNASPTAAGAQSASAPSVNATGTGILWNTGEKVNAPSQNNLDLSGAYNNFINGNAGANPYLTSALQAGVNQTNASYQKNQTDLTNSLERSVLPSIRSGAIASGQYGGTRQGIAEGNAIGDYTNQLNNSNLQLGLANSANTLGQQASAYNQGQDRSLNALNTLSGQQYSTASQNAALAQQANLANQSAGNTAAMFNASAQNAASQANANLAQSNNQYNAGLAQNNNQYNASNQLQTNNQNNSSALAGSSLLQSFLQQQSANTNAYNNYDLTQAGQVSNILSPYLGTNGSSSTTSPYYTNTAGNLVGGVTAGLGLYNQLKNSGIFNGSGSGSTASSGDYAANDWLSS